MPGPVVAFLGATGGLGEHITPVLISALRQGQLSSLRLLTSSPDSPKLSPFADVHGVEVVAIHYDDVGSLRRALEGVEVLISAMGTKPSKEGEYEKNKIVLLEAAAEAGVKIYVPSEYGTDHNSVPARALDVAMFANKQEHHAKAEELGLKVLAIYTGLFLEISFSDWLGIDSTIPSPTWRLPRPSQPVAFTSLHDVGRFVLSAVLQTYHGAGDIPSRLRVHSECVTLDEAADQWEAITGGKIERTYRDEGELKKKWEEYKASVPQGMLGPAIPLMAAQGAFDHSKDSQNTLLLRGEYVFTPTKVADFFKTLRIGNDEDSGKK